MILAIDPGPEKKFPKCHSKHHNELRRSEARYA